MDNVFSIPEFTMSLFSKKAGSPCSIKLQLTNDSKRLEALMSILVNGAKILYGPSVNPQTLSIEQFNYLQSYFYSIGYVVRFKKQYLDEEQTILHKIDIWFDELKKQVTCDGRTIIM